MTSTFGWLAHDDGERRRVLEVIDLFRERQTVDELGIASIRDAFADHLFPGTSTIQTRARYFLFIPWTYRRIEAERVPSRRAGRETRALHSRLVSALRAGGMGGGSGLIGIDAGDALQRLPRDIYWFGLGRWGIRRFTGSVERYHASLDGWYRAERAAHRSDGGEPIAPSRTNWLASLPEAPPDLFERATFDLTATEADFLAERIRHAAPGSLLAACVGAADPGLAGADYPWQIATDALPDRLRADLETARRYALVMEGAALLYNRMLAEALAAHTGTDQAAAVDRYGTELARWADEMDAEDRVLRAWDLDLSWIRLLQIHPGVSRPAWAFSRDWMMRAIVDPRGIVDDGEARTRIAYRERQTKGALARLQNVRALERWSGASGTGRLSYRWPTVRAIVADIRAGAARPAEGG